MFVIEHYFWTRERISEILNVTFRSEKGVNEKVTSLGSWGKGPQFKTSINFHVWKHLHSWLLVSGPNNYNMIFTLYIMSSLSIKRKKK